ncbi:MAG: hypothetical protein WC916_07870 [Candidatus Woesearchaeota archaeon]
MGKTDDEDIDDIIPDTDEEVDDDPIPAKRDTKIFQHKKEVKKDEEEDFEEDVFV